MHMPLYPDIFAYWCVFVCFLYIYIFESMCIYIYICVCGLNCIAWICVCWYVFNTPISYIHVHPVCLLFMHTYVFVFLVTSDPMNLRIYITCLQYSYVMAFVMSNSCRFYMYIVRWYVYYTGNIVFSALDSIWLRFCFSPHHCVFLFLALHHAAAFSSSSPSPPPHYSPYSPYSPYLLTQLISHNSSHTSHLTHISSHTTHLTHIIRCSTLLPLVLLLTLWDVPARAWTLLGSGCFRVAGTAFGAPGATFAWQVPHFDSLGCAGARLDAAGLRLLSRGRRSMRCSCRVVPLSYNICCILCQSRYIFSNLWYIFAKLCSRFFFSKHIS